MSQAQFEADRYESGAGTPNHRGMIQLEEDLREELGQDFLPNRLGEIKGTTIVVSYMQAKELLHRLQQLDASILDMSAELSGEDF